MEIIENLITGKGLFYFQYERIFKKVERLISNARNLLIAVSAITELR